MEDIIAGRASQFDGRRRAEPSEEMSIRGREAPYTEVRVCHEEAIERVARPRHIQGTDKQ